jgi:large subunit ribosomal protein L36e
VFFFFAWLHSLRVSLDLRYGLTKGRPTTLIEKSVKPSHRKGIQSQKTKFVRSIVREVAGFAPYERRVMELLRNSKVRVCRNVFCLWISLSLTGMASKKKPTG